MAEDVTGANNNTGSTATQNIGSQAAQTGNPQGQTGSQTGQQAQQSGVNGESGTLLGGQAGCNQQQAQQAQAGNQNQSTVPESYDFSALVGDDFDEATAAEFSKVLRTAGVSQENAMSLSKFGIEYAQKAVQAMYDQIQAQQTAQSAAWAQDTKKQLCGQFEETVARAGEGIQYLEKQIPELRSILNENGLGNRIEVVRLFAAIGDMVSEDRGRGAAGANGEKDLAHILYPNMQ